MQIDWHHGVIYILARLAGFSHRDGAIVAYAAQYVDDANNRGDVRFDNGATYHHIASAHKVFDVQHNLDNVEDYQVWIPFHFLPGNKGNSADRIPDVPLIDRLICTPDSPIAADMWAACLATRGSANSLHRLGITAHVYADTYAHQGFAGVRHRANMVFHVGEKQSLTDAIKDDCAALAVNAVALGHASAQTHPDTPFVHWWYRNAYGDLVDRNNPEIFGHALRRIFSNFLYYLGATAPDRGLDPRDAEVITNTLLTNTSLDCDERHLCWMDLVKEGAFSFGSPADEEMADLVYVPKGVGSWKCDALGTDRSKDSPEDVFPHTPEFESSNWKRFHDALQDHQSHILKTILPRYRIPSSYEAAAAQLC